MSLSLHNEHLLGFQPFLVAMPEVRERCELCPFEMPVSGEHCFAPLVSGTTQLFERLRALDSVTFGAEGMPMARWIFLNGAGLTGIIFGLGKPVHDATADVLAALELTTDSSGIVPYSMYIALPSFEGDTWVGHNLASIAAVKPRGELLRGLGSLTKALALKSLGARYQMGAAQWDSPSLRVHCRMGPLRLASAWTPAHSKPWTYTYVAELTEKRLLRLARDTRAPDEPREPERWLDSRDHEAMQRLQTDIESGQVWAIAAPPRPAGPPDSDQQLVGLCRLDR